MSSENGIHGEEQSLTAPKYWHDALRSIPGNYLDEHYFETYPLNFRYGIISLVSITNERLFDLPTGIIKLPKGIYAISNLETDHYQSMPPNLKADLHSQINLLFNKCCSNYPNLKPNIILDSHSILLNDLKITTPSDQNFYWSSQISQVIRFRYDKFDELTFFTLSPVRLSELTAHKLDNSYQM